MIELSNDQLSLSFPETHPDARILIEFQRTVRIPYTKSEIPRLPSLGRFPLYSVEDYSKRVPPHWLADGGAMLPMYQSEAMWLSLRPAYSVAHQAFYPFAVKLRVGHWDALRGGRWSPRLGRHHQDYLVIKGQSWLGGFQTGKGIRQFVAMPLGTGYMPEMGSRSPNRYGHLEIVAYPMSARAFAMRFPRNRWQDRLSELALDSLPPRTAGLAIDLGPDALERQSIEEGLFPFEDWNCDDCARYSLRLANSLHWCAITGGPPPTSPSRIRPERVSSVAFPTPAPVESGVQESDTTRSGWK